MPGLERKCRHRKKVSEWLKAVYSDFDMLETTGEIQHA